MIIEDEQTLNLEPSFDVKDNITFRTRLLFEDYVEGTTQIENHDSDYNLWNDLTKHLWQFEGQQLTLK
jgi:hypothetical protein